MTKARVYIAAGLPLTWVESQRESFRAYLLQNDHVDFIWRGITSVRTCMRRDSPPSCPCSGSSRA